jgi:PAS domain S-box-containing protein
MKEPSQSERGGPSLREKITGLGERSIRKSYYPQLRQKLEEIERAHEKLALSEARYRALVENISDVIISFDPKGNVSYVSPAIQNLCGLAPGKITGHKLTEFAHPSDQAGLARAFSSALAGGCDWHEFRLLDKDGRIRHVRITGRPLMEAEQAAGLTCVMSDITERKQAEDALRKLNEELERRVAERTAGLESANKELESFAYSVSHDLRAPLRAMEGFSRILLEDYKDTLDANAQRYLGLVCDGAVHMGHLIDGLLAFSRMSRQEMGAASIDMNALAVDVFAALQATEGQLNVRFVLGKLPPAHGDATMIRQVLINLLGNAIKYTQRQPEPVIEMTGERCGNESAYRIKDNGAGFDMKYASKLFGVFQRLHSAEEFEGTGIGLAIVKRIVERHGGHVSAEGKLGEGAIFRFTLPCSGDAASSSSAAMLPAT